MLRAATRQRALRGVVFDMDGTLTVPNLDFARMYERCGVPMSEDLLAAVARMSPPDAAAAQAVIDEMEEEGRRTLQLQPGALALARWLHARAIPTAIVTRNSALTVSHLQRALLEPAGVPPFSMAISRDEADVPPKPDPAALRTIAREWDVPCGPQLLMVGDSAKNDVAFGNAAGVATALVSASGRSVLEGASSAETPDFCVETLEQLIPAIDCAYRTHEVGPTAAPFVAHPAPAPGSALAEAAARGDVRALEAEARAMGGESGGVLDTPDASGNTALIWAAEGGHLDAVRWLLERGADAGARGYLGASALLRACRRGHAEVAEALLASPAGAEALDEPNDKWQSPLHFAAFKRHPAVVSLLLEHGASTRTLDRKGRTPAEDTSDERIKQLILRAREERRGAP